MGSLTEPSPVEAIVLFEFHNQFPNGGSAAKKTLIETIDGGNGPATLVPQTHGDSSKKDRSVE